MLNPSHLRHPLRDEHVKTKYGFVLLVALFLICGSVFHQHDVLPTPIGKSHAQNKTGQFITEYAFVNLKELSSYGPKVFGSYANEVLAFQFIRREATYIKYMANRVNEIIIEEGQDMGCYHLGFKPYGLVNCYDNVRNVVVKLTSSISSGNGLLLNCHFDTVPESPGSSDDGLNCAVMLEILRVLSQAQEPLKHDVIFLFNSAEETPLQGSHGFVTRHRWARDIKTFINLEACGAGGREILFQAGSKHPWLLDLYANSVPHPHAMVLAEEIFQSGLVPSDTDFRIFRDFGNLSGLDFAHAGNGYVYHTKYDNLNFVNNGTIQHTGDNMLALVRAIASSNELYDPEVLICQNRPVYFDVLGFLMVVYSEETAMIVNITIIFLSVVTQGIIVKKCCEDLSWAGYGKVLMLSVKVTIYGWLAGLFVAVTTASVLNKFNASMSWYSQPSLIFPLYFCPVILSSVLMYLICKNNMELQLIRQPFYMAQVYISGVQLIYCVLLFLCTVLGIRSGFIFLLLTAFHALTNLALILYRKVHSFNWWITFYLMGTTAAAAFMMYIGIMTFRLFIPITGRIGSSGNPELLIGILSVFICFLVTSSINPLIVMLWEPMKLLKQLAVPFIITVLIILFTPWSFPYSGDPKAPAPQRVYIHHTKQRFHDSVGKTYYDGSGYWIYHLDPSNPSLLEGFIPELSKAENRRDMCEKVLFCGFPVFLPRLLTPSHSTWITGDDPVIHLGANIKLLKHEKLTNSTMQMMFRATGPSRMEIVISPNTHVQLLDWSFEMSLPNTHVELPTGEPRWNNRNTYFIHYASGSTTGALNFTLTFMIQPEQQEAILFDVALIGHYLNDHQMARQFKEIADKYPTWVHLTPITSLYSSWKF